MHHFLPPQPYFHQTIRPPGTRRNLSVLDEADILGLLSEALTADVETVFSDETGFVCADTAIEVRIWLAKLVFFFEKTNIGDPLCPPN